MACRVVYTGKARFYRKGSRLKCEMGCPYVKRAFWVESSSGKRYKFGKVSGLYPNAYANRAFHVSLSDYVALNGASEGDVVGFELRTGNCYHCKGGVKKNV